MRLFSLGLGSAVASSGSAMPVGMQAVTSGRRWSLTSWAPSSSGASLSYSASGPSPSTASKGSSAQRATAESCG